MPLTFTPHAISIAFGTVSFFMADGDKTIRVDVPQDVLARIEGTPPRTKDGYLQQIARHRQALTKIAILKYGEGLFRPEVNVLVVRITQADLP
jgi:hypothetical protein